MPRRRLVRIAPPVNLTGKFSGEVTRQMRRGVELEPNGTSGFLFSTQGQAFRQLPVGLRIGRGRGANTAGAKAAAGVEPNSTPREPKARSIRMPRGTSRRYGG